MSCAIFMLLKIHDQQNMVVGLKLALFNFLIQRMRRFDEK